MKACEYASNRCKQAIRLFYLYFLFVIIFIIILLFKKENEGDGQLINWWRMEIVWSKSKLTVEDRHPMSRMTTFRLSGFSSSVSDTSGLWYRLSIRTCWSSFGQNFLTKRSPSSTNLSIARLLRSLF